MSNWILYPVFVLMTLIGALGSLGLKKAVGKSSGFMRLVFSPWFIGGGFLYFVSALMDIWLLKYIPYVVVLPLTALTYCWTMALAFIVLKERVSFVQVGGMCCIIAGVVLMVL